MGFLGKLFKKESTVKIPRGFYNIPVQQVNRLTKDAVEIVFSIPQELKETFTFLPGQYISVSVEIDGKEERRSYSICSAQTGHLAIAVKEVEKGTVSTFLNRQLEAGQLLLIAKPEGRFLLNDAKTVLAIAAGSGITPILSMAHSMESSASKMKLLYANKTESDILFRSQLDAFSQVEKYYYLTQESKENFRNGRITKETFIEFIKEDLGVLKSDGFFICGPEEMIFGVKAALEMFGVPAEKIHFELFNPTAKSEDAAPVATTFNGTTKVKVVLDDEVHSFDLKGNKSILDAAIAADIDAPYSCRGGVCSTCRAKVIKGSANMTLNYTLTDKEVEQGYILTCQSHPTSDELTISYDE
jgi:ring-1,2-phenylacetyl-CoA epoxidase subunit PaaE